MFSIPETNATSTPQREWEKLREAATAHVLQRDILLDELQHIKDQCRTQWETTLNTYQKLLHDLHALKAKFFHLRGRFLQPNDERIIDELSSLKKECASFAFFMFSLSLSLSLSITDTMLFSSGFNYIVTFGRLLCI
jgi:hypothetical protein